MIGRLTFAAMIVAMLSTCLVLSAAQFDNDVYSMLFVIAAAIPFIVCYTRWGFALTVKDDPRS